MMSAEEYAKITAKNLKRVAYEAGRTQADIARDLRMPKATVSAWFTGKRCPRMKYIDMLCDYFNVSRSEIMEENPTVHKELVSNEERDLLKLFRSLTAEGRAAALERIDEMTQMSKWTEQKSTRSGVG